MIDEIENLMKQYLKWLRDRTKLRQMGDSVEITTPYLDRHNDYMQIYVTKQGDDFCITDNGYTLDDLEMSGCNMKAPKRQELLETTLGGFGIQLNRNALEVRASLKDFSLRKHNLVQAMLAVNDLFYTTHSTVVSLFNEEVGNWLDESDIRHSPRIKLGGTSGYDHLFNFVIPKSRSAPERLIRVINRPNRNAAQAAVFSWRDTKSQRGADSVIYFFLNDLKDTGDFSGDRKSISPNILSALESEDDMKPVRWSEKEMVRNALAA